MQPWMTLFAKPNSRHWERRRRQSILRTCCTGIAGAHMAANSPETDDCERYREREVFHSNGGSSEFAICLRYARACSDVLSLPCPIFSTVSEGAIQLFVLTL